MLPAAVLSGAIGGGAVAAFSEAIDVAESDDPYLRALLDAVTNSGHSD